MKIYFGASTPLIGPYASSDTPDAHLQAPSLGKLMFISPPPSPPCGWEVREEDPPNKTTHAEDLIAALAGLGGGSGNGRNSNTRDRGESDDYAGAEREKEGGQAKAAEGEGSGADASPTTQGRDAEGGIVGSEATLTGARGRRGTLTVFHPKDHGGSEDLPAVMVEDTTGDEAEEGAGALPTRTARPPVELMEEMDVG